MTGCTDTPSPRRQAVEFIQSWFALAAQGKQGNEYCHGLGLLKHPTFSCSDYLTEAARVDPASRNVVEVTPLDCYETVCGDFYQIEIDAADLVGNEAQELVLLKRDDGVMRLYWYRSSAMLQQQQIAARIEEEAAKDPLQAAYDELTNRYPTLYEYPPCLDTRVSSSTLMTSAKGLEEINPRRYDELAAQCSSQMCIALVGRKYAPLCPPQ